MSNRTKKPRSKDFPGHSTFEYNLFKDTIKEQLDRNDILGVGTRNVSIMKGDVKGVAKS